MNQATFLSILVLCMLSVLTSSLPIGEEKRVTSSFSLRQSLPWTVKALSNKAIAWVTDFENTCGGVVQIKKLSNGRPCGVYATINPACFDLGEDATGNIYGWSDFKTYIAANPPPISTGESPYARCHMVPKQLGGSSAAENLFPCYQRPFNAVTMLKYENQAKAWLNKNPDGQIEYMIAPVYGVAGQKWPSSVYMRCVVYPNNGVVQDLFAVEIANGAFVIETQSSWTQIQKADFWANANCV